MDSKNKTGEMKAMKKITSWDLYETEAFSLFRKWNGQIQWMNDVRPRSGSEFFQAVTSQEAAVFDPFENIREDGAGMNWGKYFMGRDDCSLDGMEMIFVAREKCEINIAVGLGASPRGLDGSK